MLVPNPNATQQYLWLLLNSRGRPVPPRLRSDEMRFDINQIIKATVHLLLEKVRIETISIAAADKAALQGQDTYSTI